MTNAHIDYLSELRAMCYSSATREYTADGTEPEGFHDKWNYEFTMLYGVACLSYLERIFERKAPWKNTDAEVSDALMLRLECHRVVRNSYVHNGGHVDLTRANDVSIITEVVERAPDRISWQPQDGWIIVVRSYMDWVHASVRMYLESEGQL